MKKMLHVFLLFFVQYAKTSFPLPASMLTAYRNKCLQRFAQAHLIHNPVYKAVIDSDCKMPETFHNLLLCGGCYCKKAIIGMINREQSSIDIAMYRLTDIDIIKALHRAQKRGVKTRIIIDKSSIETKEHLKRFYIMSKSAKSKVMVYESNDKSIMHLKLFLFGDEYKMLGSFNCTDSACRANIEMMELIKSKEDVAMLKEYLKEVRKISAYSQRRIRST